MARIDSSEIVWDQPQVDGRRYVRERHVDANGVSHFVDYLAENKDDANERMTSRVALLEESLTSEETSRDISVKIETLDEAKKEYFDAMTDTQIKETLGLPADFEVIKNG